MKTFYEKEINMLHFNGKSNIESRGATTIGCGNEGVRVRPSEREIPDLKNRHPAGRRRWR